MLHVKAEDGNFVKKVFNGGQKCILFWYEIRLLAFHLLM